MKLLVLGRQPQISLAELVSQFGQSAKLYNRDCALVDGEVKLERLGGSLKTASVVAEFDSPLDLDSLPQTVAQLPAVQQHLNQGKAPLGLNLHGPNIGQKGLFRLGLELKKNLKAAGCNVRLVPPIGQTVTAAQLLHNRVIDTGADIIVASSHSGWLVALTDATQDIEAYSLRDYHRPGRSAKVGMLPPKLAQVMINLASPPPGGLILDPFCGTGVVLMEAALMGYSAVGCDIDPQMLQLSRDNLEWLYNQHQIATWNLLSASDARQLKLDQLATALISEGYLGPPLSTPATPTQIKQLQSELGQLVIESLRNLHQSLQPGAGVCLTLPAWKSGQGYTRLGSVDQILDLGYTLKSFDSVDQADLLYFRPGQLVARELVALVRN